MTRAGGEELQGGLTLCFSLLGGARLGEEVNDGWVGLVDFAKCLGKKNAFKESDFLEPAGNCGEYIL